MKKHNYFDDDPQEIQGSDSKPSVKLWLKNTAITVKSHALDIIHGDAFEEKPYLRKKIIRMAIVLAVFLAVVIFVASVFHVITAQDKKNDRFCADAAKVCTEYIREYGSVKWDILDETKYGENQVRLTGLCYVRRMDFDNDGTEELMLCYNNKGVYYLEVWGYDSGEFIQLYSREANSTEDETDGAWVAFYHKNNKYYICYSEKAAPQTVTLYGLHGDSFEAESRQWDYDMKNDIYSYNGKVNFRDFETIKLAVFRKSRAEVIINTVTENIDSLGDISSMAITDSKSAAELEAEAYYDVVKKRIDRYGAPKIVNEDGYSYIDGVAMVRLIDFDGDSDDELLVVYRKYRSRSRYDSYSGEYVNYDVPVYSMDVYDFNSTDARRIFSKESISNCLESENENVFYLMLKTGEKTTDIYTNIYTFENSYNYTATAKIYRLRDGRFKSAYTSKMINEYGYRQYYIDNERVYNQEFEEKGYRVPMFLDDDAEISDSAITVTYLSGRNATAYQNIINETNDTIRQLNPDYAPGEDTGEE